jgi:hypothetical protein
MSLGTTHAQTVTVDDGGATQFGDTGGFAIDFDTTTGLTANWEPDLTSQLYSIDRITVYRGTEALTGTVRLGVYTTLTIGTLGGFQGVSNNTVTLDGVAQDAPLTFTFSNITVTPQANPGAGDDIRYFVFQTGSDPITNLATESTRVAIMRAEGGDGQFNDELSAILQIGGNGLGLRTDRAPEYMAMITPVPEPTTFGLLGLAGVALASRRRRLS